jgi:hypothetical protein
LVVVIVLVSASAVCAMQSDALHPFPVKGTPGHAVELCPNPSGLQVFNSVALQRAAREADAYGRRSLDADLANTDRAWWPHVRELWKTHTARKHDTDVVVGSEPAMRSGFAVFLRPACGAATLKRTLMVTVGPSQVGPGPHCDACNAHFFYVERTGRPLLWFVY